MPTINKGSDYFGVLTYTGDGAASKTVVDTNAVSFTPDFVWIKGRSGATDHALYDAVRGTTKQLESNTQTAETTETTGLTAFTNGGFTIGNLAQVNTSGDTYVAWCWKANGNGVSNTSGSTASTVSANTTAGFSVVTYTGTGANATVGHGLGVAPKFIIVRIRNGTTNNWRVYSSSLTSASYFLYLNGTQAESSDATLWNSTAPTSSVFSLGTNSDVNASTYNYVAYCWAEIAGFSKFGSYTGNGSADGVFVYLGFRPKFVMIKRTDTTNNWQILNTSQQPYNEVQTYMLADLNNAETTANNIDFLSNGFKLRSANAWGNASGGTYIFMAFAEHPFKNSNSR